MTSSRHRHRDEARNRAEICQNVQLSFSPQVNNSALKTQPRPRPNTESAWPDAPAMTHRRARRVLEQRRLFCPRNQKDLLRSLMTKNIALAASSASIRQLYDDDSYLNVMKELRSHFSKSRILINIDIVDVLRRWHSNHRNSQIGKS